MDSEQLQWAGFGEISGLDVVDLAEESGIDTAVTFVLRGSADDVDRALAAAEFTTPPTPGVGVFQPSLPGVDLEELADPESSEDRWQNPSAQTISRLYVRGETPDGSELIHVWAFTT
ncbi:MAG: hypothetical protein GY750_16670 [Lentisphaerae bacterium]|nr:hypothetical protein [Lentisphaerota bacterium]